MGYLERLQTRIESAGFTTRPGTVNAGIYADDLNQDHGERAPAIIVHFDALEFRKVPEDPHDKQNAYREFTSRIEALRQILRRSKRAYYEERIQYYPGLYTAIIITQADEDRLNAAEEERAVFMPVWEKVYHETHDGKTAARAGREAVEAWKEKKTA